MKLARIRHLPVVNNNRLVGLVTHRDLLRAQVSSLTELTAEESKDINSHIPVAQIMTRQVMTVKPTTSALEAATIMAERKIGCLPVVEDEELQGLITEADFLNLVIKALKTSDITAES
ncbi:MAG: CBS domain-containing protein [Deltaproteobacteria bacterium]|nr:CBS domain-containing protein [Deltaproteobacteria bacterium]